MDVPKTGRLILEDNTEFSGISFGADRDSNGEVVFNTGMVGYPETLTDPSYNGQILVMTYPLIGNYGIPDTEQENGLLRHFESDRIRVRGLIVSEYTEHHHHWSSVKSLSKWLIENNIPALSGVDTRALTKRLRSDGTLLGCLHLKNQKKPAFEDPNLSNLVAEVSVPQPVEYIRGSKRVIIVDCGVKNNIIQSFLRRDITVIRVPWDHNFSNIKADGIVLSNGPGDPTMCLPTIEHTRQAMAENKPVLGICLGSQILALAAGAKTYKLKFGHRSQNQPCSETGTRRCYITSQNHGYAVEASTLPEDWREWFYNDNDGTNEGLLHISRPFFGAQFHPEASPGPDDTEFLFDMFIRAMQ